MSKNSAKENENHLVDFSKKIPLHEIQTQLILLHNFIEAYNLFTVREDVLNQKKIYEAILYAFVSPFIWKMRDHYALNASESMRSSFPPFLVLAGRASSGKTSILELIGLLMGHQPHYISAERLNDNVIKAQFHSEMLLPILLDEMAESFFSGKKGEKLIKYVSNELSGIHPCLIGTTNASNFSMPPQTERRIYYLEINNTFTSDKYSESRKYLYEIQQQLNQSLFQDFTYRMGEIIKNEQEFYSEDDYLSGARKIFLKYYELTSLLVPPYFPTSKFNDYRQRGKVLWTELFKRYPDKFLIDKKENKIFVDNELLGKNQKERESKIRYLPVEVIAEDNNILILKKDQFLDYINQNEKRGIFQRFFK